MRPAARGRILGAAIVGVSLAGSAPSVAAQSEETERIAMVTTVIDEIMDTSDAAIPRAVMEGAAGIAIFPSTIKGGGSSSAGIVARVSSWRGTPRPGPGRSRRS